MKVKSVIEKLRGYSSYQLITDDGLQEIRHEYRENYFNDKVKGLDLVRDYKGSMILLIFI